MLIHKLIGLRQPSNYLFTGASKSLASVDVHKSAIADHVVSDNNLMNWNNFKILDCTER